jgi:hypothetical protein
MEPEGPLQPITGSYPELDYSSPHFHSLLININSNIIPHLRLGFPSANFH